jgi:SAM-dependent methyltransferase
VLRTSLPGGGGFRGRPFAGPPDETWNQAEPWEAYYENLMSDDTDPDAILPKEVFRTMATYPKLRMLLQVLPEVARLPLAPDAPPYRVLDAGCGVAAIPHILKYWGFDVTAVDLSSRAIEFCKGLDPSERDLAQCIIVWEPSTLIPGTLMEVKDPERALNLLRTYRSTKGQLTYMYADWHDDCLQAEYYDLILCRNSLCRSYKKYWRSSLKRFRELLKDGGVLILTNINAIGIMEEVQELLREANFTKWTREEEALPGVRRVCDVWPTG